MHRKSARTHTHVLEIEMCIGHVRARKVLSGKKSERAAACGLWCEREAQAKESSLEFSGGHIPGGKSRGTRRRGVVRGGVGAGRTRRPLELEKNVVSGGEGSLRPALPRLIPVGEEIWPRRPAVDSWPARRAVVHAVS